MAGAAVEFVLANLQRVLVHHINLIMDAKDNVVELEKDLRQLRAYLKDATANNLSSTSSTLQLLTRDIRDVAYEADDVIDTFITQANDELNSRHRFFKPFKKAVNRHSIAPQVREVRNNVRKILDRVDFAAINIGHGAAKPSLEDPLINQDNVVGIEGEANKIILRLKEKTDYLDVISVIGMAGLGKTTLAREVFYKKEIQSEFHICIWVTVSQKFTRRNLFLKILNELTKVPDDEMHKSSDDELARMVKDELKKKKFLIVMDDVWAVEDWKEIEIALPKIDITGKILITSRHHDVAQCANPQRRPAHRLPFLSEDDSWLLLKHEVFGKSNCPSDLEEVGIDIAKHCGGLPLAIVVIGGILVKKFLPSEDMPMKKVVVRWERVLKNVGALVNSEQRMKEIISLSYNILPPHLQPCFLYLGMFPEDSEIPVKKLIPMWVAEGFIEPKEDMSAEEIAESYLDDLIRWNLVKIEKWRSDGGVKTCHIHDMLREFCIRQAENDNFFQELKKILEESQHARIADKEYHRICVHSWNLNSIPPALSFPQLRSFICFSKSDSNSPSENISDMPVVFKLIRVLDVASIKFSKVPKNMYKLLHLRYIVVSLHSAVLPSKIANLWNSETLIVHTTSRTLKIKGNIWKLSQLRHLKTNVSTLLPKAEKIPMGGNLHTLETISPKSCTETVLNRCQNLKKLGIRGKLALLVDEKTEPFSRLRKLINLEKLKLFNDASPYEGFSHRLPLTHQFPPKLKSLTLSHTFIGWDRMDILRLLKNLDVLKLKEDAFCGTSWEVKDLEDGGFVKLDFLHIGRMDLTTWNASHHHFPKLRCLELHNCEKLQEIPIAFANISDFQILDLHHSNHAVNSARNIQRVKQESLPDVEFKLSISPTTVASYNIE